MEYYPLTSERWSDFEQLFGPNGAYGGCWCMWWRIKRREFEKNGSDGNRSSMNSLVQSGKIPGILVYSDGKAIAWCSIAPRADYDSLNRSHVLKPLDDTPVWSLVCLFVARSHRRKGLITNVIKSALDYARNLGAVVVEAYPTAPRGKRLPPVSSFMGIPSMFEKAGFVEVSRPSESKVIMRYSFE